jgi:phosphoenolpyruvate-protein kinase (PTS system EI component)
VLDANGVGKLVRLAIADGRSTRRPSLKVGICGEHGGEPRSVRFCHDAGLDYVSCSPYRVPVGAPCRRARGARRTSHLKFRVATGDTPRP